MGDGALLWVRVRARVAHIQHTSHIKQHTSHIKQHTYDVACEASVSLVTFGVDEREGDAEVDVKRQC